MGEALYTQFKADPAKPYLMGDDLPMAEIAMMPFLDRMVPTLEHYRNFNLFRGPNSQPAARLRSGLCSPGLCQDALPRCRQAHERVRQRRSCCASAPHPDPARSPACADLIAGGLVGAAAAFALLRAR